MPKFQDLTGRKFYCLTVIDRAPNRGRQTRWNCRCECGNITTVDSNNLKSGSVKSCGCKQFSALADRFTKNEIGNRFSR